MAPRWFKLFFRWLPLAPRWFKLFSGGCRWPRGGSSCLFRWFRWPRDSSSCFPVVAVGPAVVQAVFQCLPLAPRWFKLLSGGCRWPRGGSTYFSGGCRWPRGGSSCFPVAPRWFKRLFRWLPLAPRWFKLFSGACRWPRGGSSCFPVVAVGPAVVQAVFRCLLGAKLAQVGPEMLSLRLLGGPRGTESIFDRPGGPNWA